MSSTATLTGVHEPMTRRGWLLFAAMSVIWGIPYLLIKVAVKHVDPPVVVFGRTSIAAAVLLVLAARSGALRRALRHWRPVLLFAAVEMGAPWLLLTNAERRLPSGLTGLLVACVPLFGALAAYTLGDHAALRPVRLVGIVIGLGGVALLVGGDLGGGAHGIPWWSVLQVMLVCVGYAIGPFIIDRRLADVPSIGVVAVSLAAVAIVVAPLAWLARPAHVPPANTWAAIITLAAVCTGLAFVVFFALIAEIGPTARDAHHVRQPRGRGRVRRGGARRAHHARDDGWLRPGDDGLLARDARSRARSSSPISTASRR